MVVEKQAINETNTLNYNTLTKHQCQKTDKSPFAELAYFIRNFFLHLTTNTFMSGIPNHSLHSLITFTDTVL